MTFNTKKKTLFTINEDHRPLKVLVEEVVLQCKCNINNLPLDYIAALYEIQSIFCQINDLQLMGEIFTLFTKPVHLRLWESFRLKLHYEC